MHLSSGECNLKMSNSGAAWVAQSVKRPTRSGQDLTVHEFEPRVGLCADSSEPGACFRFCVSLSLSLLLSLSLPLPRSCSVFLSLSLSLKNKYLKKCPGMGPLGGPVG